MYDLIASIKREHALDAHPYFQALTSGEFSRDDFIETQIQFLFAVVFFSRPMAVLLGRVPLPSMRLGLMENVADEHGGGDLRHAHEATFLTLLARLGVSHDEVEARALWPEVRSFNTTLTGAAVMDDVPTAMAALGMIEDLFSGVSARIGRDIVARGWLSPAELIHYRAHEALDVEHARDFYDVIEPTWRQSARGRYQVEQGLRLGAYLLMGMYRELWFQRGRRWTRQVRGPHSIADGWALTP